MVLFSYLIELLFQNLIKEQSKGVIIGACVDALSGSTPYLIFVIFFTLAKFLETKIYTEKRHFFALNL